MDKVIIDGVDVSECEHYRAEIETKMPYGEYEIQKDKCHYSGIEVIQNCKGIKGCYYKQLKRLERQYENVLKIAKENADSNEYCLQELEQENERLKEEIRTEKIYSSQIEELEESLQYLQAENERLKEENYGLNQELLGYKKGVQASEIIELKQALQEIKRIIIQEKVTNNKKLRAILDLITKAEEENE